MELGRYMSHEPAEPVWSEHQYTVIPFLMGKGFVKTLAERISDELGLEEPGDVAMIRKANIDALACLDDDQRANLWRIVRVEFAALSDRAKTQIRENHRLLYHCDRTETSMSDLLLKLQQHIGDSGMKMPEMREWRGRA